MVCLPDILTPRGGSDTFDLLEKMRSPMSNVLHGFCPGLHTFRSNQIRECPIDRYFAPSRIAAENRPRIESMAWYFDTIGLDAVAAIERVNAMPTLYG